MKTANEIATAIVAGNFSTADMNIIIDAVKNAQRLTRQRNGAVAMASIRVGATGVLQGLTPKSINGTKVKVVGIKRSRVVVQEEGNTGYSGRYTVPAECVKLD